MKNTSKEDIIGITVFALMIIAIVIKLEFVTKVLSCVFVSALAYRANVPKILSHQNFPVSRLISAFSCGISFFVIEWWWLFPWEWIGILGLLPWIGFMGSIIWEAYRKLDLKSGSPLSRVYFGMLKHVKEGEKRGYDIPWKISNESGIKLATILFFSVASLLVFFPLLMMLIPAYDASTLILTMFIGFLWLLLTFGKKIIESFKGVWKVVSLGKVRATVFMSFLKQILTPLGLLYGLISSFFLFNFLLSMISQGEWSFV